MKLVTRLLFLSLLVRCASTDVVVTREALGPYDCVDAAANLASPPPRNVLDLGIIRGDSREVQKTRPRKALIDIEACGGAQVPVSRTPAKNNVAKGNPLFRPNEMKVEDFFRGSARPEKKDWSKVYYIPPGLDREPHRVPPDPPGCNGISWFGSCFYYGPASFNVAADGGGMTMRIQKPAFSGDGHSLDEIAVQGGASNGNIIEIGWNVAPFQYAGDSNPHLFVFHWIDDKPTCYDGCGWVQYSKTYFPGMSLSALIGKSVYVGYVIYNGNWWAWFDNQWLGYFPGSEWGGAYTKSNLIQWFGEVATNNGIPPKVQMGNGLFPPNSSAAVNRTLCDVDAAAWVCWVRDQQSLGPTYPPYFDINRTGFGETRYGGPGL